MARLPIVIWGNPVLKQKAKEVTVVDDELRKLASDMFETMRADNGVGLAGNQVGVLKRIFTVEIPKESGDSEKFVILNPVITKKSRKTETLEEGCLSFPGIYGPVERFYEVEVSGIDLDMKPLKISGSGLMARAIQHELDHLDGIVFIEKMNMLNRTMLNKKLRELAKKTRADLLKI